jgi:methylenetetrahydrofolate reductase (NADPH)
MYLSELLRQKKCLFSFEIFPPKKISDIDAIYRLVSSLQRLCPDFISITCGAGGSSVGDNLTAKIACYIKKEYDIEPLAHLTCINSSRNNIEEVLSYLKTNSITNVLALRGDRIKDGAATDFMHASDLVSLIRRKGGFYIAAACHPEGHPESRSKMENIHYLKEKIEAGASHLMSQLFFDNDIFYTFMNEVRAANITVPVGAGVMPIVSKLLIEKIVSLCGATLPSKFSGILNRFEDNPTALFEAGIDYATEQIVGLISFGVQGIHLYTMNNAIVAEKITKNIANSLREVNNN